MAQAPPDCGADESRVPQTVHSCLASLDPLRIGPV